MPSVTLLGKPGCHLCDDARAIEPEIPGFPERAQASLLTLLPKADAAPLAQRAVVYALAGQASVLARRIAAYMETH